MWDGSIRTFPEVRRNVAHLRESGLTWRAMATSPLSCIKVPRMAACLCAIYKHGREPKAADIRAALGLPVTVAVAVCGKCGQPPLSKHHRCPGAEHGSAGSPPRKPRRNWKGLALVLAGVLAQARNPPSPP